MKRRRLKRGKRGLSPVISSVILAAAVLTIGISVWTFATGSSGVIQESYCDEVIESAERVQERFCIENMGLDQASNTVTVWVLNYGPIDLTIDAVRVTGGSNVSSHAVDVVIPIGEVVRIDVTPSEVSLLDGLSLSLEVISRRGNKAYDSILIP
jgi:archaellum component FlaF (FlaF/FlaG flagellin family)